MVLARKIILRQMRQKRIRAKIKGTLKRPRLSVSKSRKHIFLQLIDDQQGRTIIGLSDLAVKKKAKGLALAQELGKLLAERALRMGVKKIIFDRRGYAYHGKVKAVAEGAREGGLEF